MCAITVFQGPCILSCLHLACLQSVSPPGCSVRIGMLPSTLTAPNSFQATQVLGLHHPYRRMLRDTAHHYLVQKFIAPDFAWCVTQGRASIPAGQQHQRLQGASRCLPRCFPAPKVRYAKADGTIAAQRKPLTPSALDWTQAHHVHCRGVYSHTCLSLGCRGVSGAGAWSDGGPAGAHHAQRRRGAGLPLAATPFPQPLPPAMILSVHAREFSPALNADDGGGKIRFTLHACRSYR